jgi:hypothetical protein
VNTGLRLRTDRRTFEEWAGAMSGVALPSEMEFDLPPGWSDSGGKRLPPAVAASLALHGCADVAVTLRCRLPDENVFGCFAIAGDLGGSLVRAGDKVEIGLFGLESVVAEVIRLIPVDPPQLDLGAQLDPGRQTVRVELTVLAADAATPGWQQTLVGGAPRWRRERYRRAPSPPWLESISDVHQELASELRFALAECLSRPLVTTMSDVRWSSQTGKSISGVDK